MLAPSFALVVSALAQLSAASIGSGAGQSLAIPTLDRAPNAPNPRHHTVLAAMPAPETSHLTQCLDHAESDPGAAISEAQGWLKDTPGGARAEPELCMGVAYANLGQWDKAGAAFAAGRDVAASSDRELRTRLLAMGGNAALGGGDAPRALPLLDAAQGEALAQGDTALAGGIALDRARALVALGRLDDAGKALADARQRLPDEPQAFLLSATLARRQGQLGAAQGFIEKGAAIAPHDAEIGLEAGVIAMLAGHEAAARLSWQSVLANSPDPTAPAARQARAYLDQIGQAAAPPQR